MTAFISKKLSLLLLICAWGAAVGIVFLSNYALAGPKLGPVYDLLLGFRSPPPISGEILLIETDEVIEPDDIFSVLMTLSEMNASNLLVEVPVLGSGSGRAESGLELSYRVNDEFNLLQRNIQNLFEGIRLGLVSPVESPVYVGNLLELTERGRDRLNAAFIRQDEAGSIMAAQAAAVFGRSLTAMDLRPYASVESQGGIPWYSRPLYDSDRILRRIAPIMKTEHIVYHLLKSRWTKSEIEHTEAGLIMVNRFEWQGEELEYRFPLDRDGNIIIEKPGKTEYFRRVNLDQFRSYDQLDRAMARLLKDAEALGVYAQTMPERIPLILHNYAESLKDQLLQAPDPEKYRAWVDARTEYITALDEFLYSPSEMILVNGYEELIATEGLNETGIARLQDLRDELIRAFVSMREKHRELAALRDMLTEAIDSSLCIMGPPTGLLSFSENLNIPEASALLANTLLTGTGITPGQDWYILFFSVVASLLILTCIHALRPSSLFVAGLSLSIVCGAAFGVSFIISAYWIDPFIPMAACLGGTLLLFVTRFGISYGRMIRFRIAFTSSVNNDMLKRLIKAGRPRLSETLCVQAVIIAVKNPGMSAKEDRETPLNAAKAAAQFRREFTSLFKQTGALVLGFENDIALACFGSPPHRVCEKNNMDSMTRIATAIRETLSNPVSAGWNFGIESGECAFSWSEKTGYTANGRAVVRARILALLAARHQVQAVIGSAARDSTDFLIKKISTYAGENFYELRV
jgi:hypothetical protein